MVIIHKKWGKRHWHPCSGASMTAGLFPVNGAVPHKISDGHRPPVQWVFMRKPWKKDGMVIDEAGWIRSCGLP
jgi:hypothetical protein